MWKLLSSDNEYLYTAQIKLLKKQRIEHGSQNAAICVRKRGNENSHLSLWA